MSEFSLEKLCAIDSNFAAIFAKKAVEIKKNKTDLLEAAKSYQDKYQAEIEQGTIKQQIMLTEGRAKGLKEDDIFRDNQLFIPTKQTPILNYLFFLLRETKFQDVDISVLRNHVDAHKDIQLLKEEYERKYGAEVHTDHDADKQKTPNMVKFIYGNIGDDTMSTLKKLKTMAMSENEKEAFVAFRKGREMAQKFNLDWDKIPYNR
jgi:hypothetical protein